MLDLISTQHKHKGPPYARIRVHGYRLPTPIGKGGPFANLLYTLFELSNNNYIPLVDVTPWRVSIGG